MPNLKDIRKRISSVKNTQKITQAMKMVAAAKLRRAQERMEAARPYAKKMSQVIESLSSRVDAEAHPLLVRRERRDSILLIVVSSNRGLCGGFNSNLFRAVDRFIGEHKVSGEKISVMTVGRKAHSHFRKQEALEIYEHQSDVIGEVSFQKAKRIASIAIDDYVGERFDAVYVCYNQFVSAIAYNSLIRPVLPLSMEELGTDEGAADVSASAGEYIYEPDVETLLARLLPGHVEIQIMQALFESEASEHSARMTSMDAATNNASDMISSLTLQYNRARQAYITREIVEIVSGAESLKG